MMAIERPIDAIAWSLGLDPLDVRKRNFCGAAGRDMTPYSMRVTDNVMPQLTESLEKTSDCRKRRTAVAAFNAKSQFLKRGIALTPVVQKDVGLSVSQVATIAAVYTWAFALCQFFGGALLDRLGSRKVLPISIALVTVGSVHVCQRRQLWHLAAVAGDRRDWLLYRVRGRGYIGSLWFGMAKFGFMLSAIYVRNPAPLAGRMDRGVGDFFTSVIGNIAKVAAIGHVWIASLIGAAQFGVMLALGVVKRFQMPAQ